MDLDLLRLLDPPPPRADRAPTIRKERSYNLRFLDPPLPTPKAVPQAGQQSQADMAAALRAWQASGGMP